MRFKRVTPLSDGPVQFGYARAPWLTIADERNWIRLKHRMACWIDEY